MPISEAQLAANQANAQKSTGPRTPEGKNISRLNGVRHRVTQQVMIMPEPEMQAYLDFHKEQQIAHAPADPIEKQLVQPSRLELDLDATDDPLHGMLSYLKPADHHLARLRGAKTKSVDVPVTTLNDLLADHHTTIDLVVLDVCENEIDVLDARVTETRTVLELAGSGPQVFEGLKERLAVLHEDHKTKEAELQDLEHVLSASALAESANNGA